VTARAGARVGLSWASYRLRADVRRQSSALIVMQFSKPATSSKIPALVVRAVLRLILCAFGKTNDQKTSAFCISDALSVFRLD
jgi:hypothetical protein